METVKDQWRERLNELFRAQCETIARRYDSPFEMIQAGEAELAVEPLPEQKIEAQEE
jgi:hypothetical protein